MKIIGIDPGKSGSLIVIKEDGGIFYRKAPETPKDVLTLLRMFSKNSYCFIEKVHGMPAMSGGGMFRFGENFGWWVMAIQATGIPVELVTPQTWMKYYQFGTKGDMTGTQWKNKLRAKAQQMYPNLNVTLQMADALLIAEYGRRIYNTTIK